MTTKRYCLRGHDTEAVGRTKGRTCRECLRAWDRARNARRRLDPAYVAAEFHYKAKWYLFRGSALASGRRMAANVAAFYGLMDQLADRGLARHADNSPEIREPRGWNSHDDWNGDPDDIDAPPYKWRAQSAGWLQYPRVTKEVVEEIARTDAWIRGQREQRGSREGCPAGKYVPEARGWKRVWCLMSTPFCPVLSTSLSHIGREHGGTAPGRDAETEDATAP